MLRIVRNGKTLEWKLVAEGTNFRCWMNSKFTPNKGYGLYIEDLDGNFKFYKYIIGSNKTKATHLFTYKDLAEALEDLDEI